MAIYAQKVVPGDWDINNPLPFTEEQYQRHASQIESGTSVVIYQAAPVNGIVAEGQVSGVFVHVVEWQGTSAIRVREAGAPHLLPVQILYKRGGPGIMPLARVREILEDPLFPRPDQDWRLLTNGQYGELRQDFR